MSGAWQVAEVLAQLAAAAGVSAGILLRRPPNRRAWWLLATGLGALALGDLLALAGSSPADGIDGAGLADAAYLTAYLLIVVALFGLRPRGDRAGDRAALVDAAGIATSLTLLAWVFLIGSATGTGSTLDDAVTVASLLLDGALLCVALRLVVTGPARPVPALLALGAGALLATDLVHAGEPGSRADLTDPAHVGWLVAAVLFAAAALHPAAAKSFAPTAERPEKPSVRRLALLAALVLLPPVLIALQAARGEDDDVGVLSAGLGLLMVLVLVRAGLLVRDLAALDRLRPRRLDHPAALHARDHALQVGDRGEAVVDRPRCREAMIQLNCHRRPPSGWGPIYARRVPIQGGKHRLGPDDATLSVRTGRGGAAAKAGHDLLMRVTSWEAELVVGEDPADTSIELTADAALAPRDRGHRRNAGPRRRRHGQHPPDDRRRGAQAPGHQVPLDPGGDRRRRPAPRGGRPDARRPGRTRSRSTSRSTTPARSAPPPSSRRAPGA